MYIIQLLEAGGGGGVFGLNRDGEVWSPFKHLKFAIWGHVWVKHSAVTFPKKKPGAIIEAWKKLHQVSNYMYSAWRFWFNWFSCTEKMISDGTMNHIKKPGFSEQ